MSPEILQHFCRGVCFLNITNYIHNIFALLKLFKMGEGLGV